MGHGLALSAGVALAVLVVSARWSITGAQLATWLILVLPSYVILPVWESLTGNVIVPGSSILTKVALACPTLAALGMATGRASPGSPVGTYPRGEAPRFCRRCDLQSGAYRRVMRT